MEAQDTRYFFVFEYAKKSSFGVAANTLQQARQIFRDRIALGPRKYKNEEKRVRAQKKHEFLLSLDIDLIEPKIYQ